MFDIFFAKLRILLRNPMALFIYGIFSKWYSMVMIAAIVVTFWVFQGLKDTGIMDQAEKVVSKALNDTKSVARYCTPKIRNLGDFWDCLQNPPTYEPTEEEQEIYKNINNQSNTDPYGNAKNPYEQ